MACLPTECACVYIYSTQLHWCVCECVYTPHNNTSEWLLFSSGLPLLSLCSNHMRVELRDDDGDVITVHAS